MPSLHAAFPVLGLLYAVKLWGRRAWPLALWCVGVCFSIVYLGEHYVADAVAGILFAGASYWAVESVFRLLGKTGEANPRLSPVELVDRE
jgi:membrane-associated phospholipid phosphatase